MNNSRAILTLFFIILMVPAQARLFLNVSILNKKGIDIGLTLGSELHSVEEVRENQTIELKMRSGIRVVLEANFVEAEEQVEGKNVYGPLSRVEVKGRIINGKNEVIKDFTKEPILIALEKKEKIIHSQDSQLVEIILRPHLK